MQAIQAILTSLTSYFMEPVNPLYTLNMWYSLCLPNRTNVIFLNEVFLP